MRNVRSKLGLSVVVAELSFSRGMENSQTCMELLSTWLKIYYDTTQHSNSTQAKDFAETGDRLTYRLLPS